MFFFKCSSKTFIKKMIVLKLQKWNNWYFSYGLFHNWQRESQIGIKNYYQILKTILNPVKNDSNAQDEIEANEKLLKKIDTYIDSSFMNAPCLMIYFKLCHFFHINLPNYTDNFQKWQFFIFAFFIPCILMFDMNKLLVIL